MTKRLGVGMVGYGFIAKVHTYAYLNIPLFYDPSPSKIDLVGVCTTHKETGEKAIQQAGYKFSTTNYKELLKRKDIDIIDCCTPNYLHKEMVINALKADKHVYCDKPLAFNLKEAKEILKIALKSRIIHQMAFEYRFIPAIMRAKQLIDEGFLGKAFHFHACYLHSGYVDPNRPISWRLEKKKSGGGAVFDLGSHVFDLIRYLLGEYESVFATTETFIKERPDTSGKLTNVDVDDIGLLQFKMANGALGAIEVSRVAAGTNDELRLELYGSQGAIYFNLMDPNWLYVYDNREKGEPIGGNRGFKRIETVQRYPKPAILPGPKFSIGWMRYHIASQYQFVKSIVERKPSSPNIEDGVRCQGIMESIYLSSNKKTWVRVNSEF